MTSRPRRPAAAHASPRRTGGSRAGWSRHIGPFAITPFRIVLAAAFLGALTYIAWAIAMVNDSTQIPMVTTGIGVLGIVFAALSAGGAIRMWRAWQAHAQGQMLVFAFFGGIAGMIALACFAGTLVLSLVWGS